MEDMENMEAEVPAKVEAKRRLLCRKHKLLASEHHLERDQNTLQCDA